MNDQITLKKNKKQMKKEWETCRNIFSLTNNKINKKKSTHQTQATNDDSLTLKCSLNKRKRKKEMLRDVQVNYYL